MLTGGVQRPSQRGRSERNMRRCLPCMMGTISGKILNSKKYILWNYFCGFGLMQPSRRNSQPSLLEGLGSELSASSPLVAPVKLWCRLALNGAWSRPIGGSYLFSNLCRFDFSPCLHFIFPEQKKPRFYSNYKYFPGPLLSDSWRWL